MFDYVILSIRCPKCNDIISNFKSSSGPCIMTRLDLSDIRSAYGECPNCHSITEIFKKPRKNTVATDFELYINSEEPAKELSDYIIEVNND